MIALPHGKVVYSDLRISAVRMDKFLKSLQSENFTGYLRLETPDLTGVIFYDTGKIIAVKTFPEVSDPLVSIMEVSSRSDGTISVYAFSPEIINILAAAVAGKEVFSGVPFEIVDVEKLFSWLIRRKFSGVLLIRSEEDEVNFSVFFFEGTPLEYIYESIDATIKGEKAMDKIKELQSLSDSVIALYEATFERADVGEIGDKLDPLREVKEFFDDIVPRLGLDDKRLRMVSNQLADRFPFLDPFIPSVYFKNGELVVEDESIPVKEIMEGLKELLRGILEGMKEKDRDKAKAVIKNALSGRPILQSFLELVE